MLIVSFVALSTLWTTPRAPGRRLPAHPRGLPAARGDRQRARARAVRPPRLQRPRRRAAGADGELLGRVHLRRSSGSVYRSRACCSATSSAIFNPWRSAARLLIAVAGRRQRRAALEIPEPRSASGRPLACWSASGGWSLSMAGIPRATVDARVARRSATSSSWCVGMLGVRRRGLGVGGRRVQRVLQSPVAPLGAGVARRRRLSARAAERRGSISSREREPSA